MACMNYMYIICYIDSNGKHENHYHASDDTDLTADWLEEIKYRIYDIDTAMQKSTIAAEDIVITNVIKLPDPII